MVHRLQSPPVMRNAGSISCLFLTVLAGCADDAPEEHGPVVLAEEPETVEAMAVSDSDVIVAGFSALYSVPKTGGELREIIDTGDRIWGLVAVDADSVYWHEWNGEIGVIRAVEQTGNGLRDVATAADLRNAAIDDTHVYYAGGDPTWIERVAKSGGAVESLGVVPAAFEVFGIHVDDTSVFLVGHDDLGETAIWRLPKAGGAPELIANEPDDLAVPNSDSTTAAFVADETHLYFWVRGSNAVVSVPKTGGPTEHILDIGHCGYDAAIDAINLYWGCDGGNLIQTGPKAGGATSNVDLGGFGAGVFAVDETHLYWASPDGIVALEKQPDEPQD